MILVADSGTTKTDWLGTEKEETIFQGQSIGLNPVLLTAPQIEHQVRAELADALAWDSVTQVFFYGSGCATDLRKQVVFQALSAIFHYADIYIEHDLIGAARACSGDQPGIVCILGTGSNSCYYDGDQIQERMYSLGYLLGDEGSGTDLGRKLIRARYYNLLASELEADFDQFLRQAIGIEKDSLVDHLYKLDSHPRFLASFVPFLVEHKYHPDLKTILEESFTTFLQLHVLRYDRARQVPIHFVGSVSWLFQSILKELLQEHGLVEGKWVQRPVSALLQFHSHKKIEKQK